MIKPVLPALCLLSSAFGQESVVIAKSGDSTGGVAGTLFEIDSSYLADSGEVYFSGTLRENGQFKNSGLFKGSGDRTRITALVLSGDPTPNNNGTISNVLNSGFQANAAGDVVALLPLVGTVAGNRDNAGLYFVGGPGRRLTQISRKGEMIPDGNGGTFTRTPLGFSLSNKGQLAFSASVVETSLNFSGNTVYLQKEGVETEIFRSGTRTPQNDGTLANLNQVTFPRLNETGQVLLSVGIAPDVPSGPPSGIVLASESGITTVARESQSVPNGNGILNALAVTIPAIGNGGHVAFWSQLRNTTAGSADAAAILRFDGSGLVEIARRNDLLPDGNGRYLGLFDRVDVNRGGEVVFQSTISGASQGSDEGIFAGNGTSSRIIARVGDAAPEGGTLGDFVEESVRFNDSGQVLFAAELKFSNPAAPVGSLGLFLNDPNLGLLEIARERENFSSLGTITRLIPNLRGQVKDPSKGSLNAKGQVVYRAVIGGDAVVLRWTPPPGAGPLLVPTPGIAKSGDDLILRWPQTQFSVVLQSTMDLSNDTSWMALPGIVAVLDGGIFKATVPINEDREFFRLRRSNW